MKPMCVFAISPLDAQRLHPQVSRALEKRTELVSRQKCPKLWALTDKLNGVAKSPQSVRENRKKRRVFLGLLDWLLGSFLLMTGLVEPRTLLLLLVGAAAFGAGVVILWRNRRTALGVLSLIEGVFFSMAGLGNRAKLGGLLVLGIVILAVGIAALGTRKREKTNPFDRAAWQLLREREGMKDAEQMQVSFSDDGMCIGKAHHTEGERTVPYGGLTLVLETEDLLLPVFADSMLILQKKDLRTGSLPQLREFLRAQTPYVPLL